MQSEVQSRMDLPERDDYSADPLERPESEPVDEPEPLPPPDSDSVGTDLRKAPSAVSRGPRVLSDPNIGVSPVCEVV